MPTEVLMPALSPTMEEGKLAKWMKSEGDEVRSGDVIAEIETDKATMEVEAVDEGKLGKILVPAGTEGVKVNTPIAVILVDGEDVSALANGHAGKTSSPRPFTQGERETAAQPSGDGEFGRPLSPRGERQSEGGLDHAPLDVRVRDTVPEALAPAYDSAAEIPEGTEMVQMTMREALRDAMAEEMRRDDAVFVMGEEVAEYQGAYKITQGLLDEFGPRRVIDTPITEAGFAGLGIGAGFAGLRPIVEFMTFNFAMQAIDQIINSAAKTHYMSGGQMGCPIVFRGPNGAASRVGAQHSQDYSAWYAHVPGLKVIAPSTAADAKGLLKAAIRDPNPVVFLENEILYGATGQVPKTADYVIPIGKAKIARPGKDVTIVSWARGMVYSLEAAKVLGAEGIDAEVIDLRTLRPLDMETVLASVRKTNRIVTVEEAWPVCSLGSEICAAVAVEAFDYLDAPPAKVSGEDVPMPYAANLEKLALPDAARVVKAVKAVCYRT
ncbi:MAG: pyruvate dehydrogenase complex E1 component subunit beta [Rhodomicrobium sp.]